MNLYQQFKTDSNVEKKGITIRYGNDGDKPIEFVIARAGGANTAYNKVLEAKLKPYRRQIQNETMDTDTMVALIRDVYATTVVIGWNNVRDADGNELPFTRENCIKLFTDLPELFEDIQTQANRAALFREEVLEIESKN